jgi:hypothetical protein
VLYVWRTENLTVKQWVCRSGPTRFYLAQRAVGRTCHQSLPNAAHPPLCTGNSAAIAEHISDPTLVPFASVVTNELLAGLGEHLSRVNACSAGHPDPVPQLGHPRLHTLTFVEDKVEDVGTFISQGLGH